MSSDYGIATPNGNLFLQKLHISPDNATTFGNLPNPSSLNSKYWKKIYTDRSVIRTGGLLGSGMKDDGSFFIAGTFVGKNTAFPSVDGPTAITGNDIFDAIVGRKIEFDDFGNIRIFSGSDIKDKDWKNPLTPVKMADRTVGSIDMPNSTFILSRNGRWILAQDTELSQKGYDKVYYVMFNPIHSGGTNTEDPYYTTSSTFKKWYNSQLDTFGTNPDPNRLEEPLLQKYCEMTAQKPGNRFETNKTTPFQTSFTDIYSPQEGDNNRNYGDQSCYILVNKEGVYNAVGAIVTDRVTATMAQEDAICNTINGPNNYANSNRKGNFIIDYMKDKKKKALGGDKECTKRSINFCSTIINSAGDVNMKGSNIVNECGKQYPSLITPAPTTPAPTTRPPTLAPTTQPPTLAPTTQPPTLAPTTRPSTLVPTNAPTNSPTNVPTNVATTAPSTTPAPSSSNMMMMAIAGVAVVAVVIVVMKMKK